MSDPNQPTTPPGWYPDGQGNQRWWDGTQWTDHVQPLPPAAAPEPPAAPQQPAPSAGDATVFAPNRAADYDPGAAQGGWAPPPAQPGQPSWGQPAQPSYGQPGQSYGEPAWNQPGAGGSQGKGKGKLFAIIGGVFAFLVLAVVAVVVLVSVLGGASPESVAKDYLVSEDFSDPEFDTNCELRAEDNQQQLLDGAEVDTCAEYSDKQEEEYDSYEEEEVEDGCGLTYGDLYDEVDASVDISKVTEKGDSAVVDYEQNYEFTGDKGDLEACGEDEASSNYEGTLLLCKEDGDWKVALDGYDEESDVDCGNYADQS